MHEPTHRSSRFPPAARVSSVPVHLACIAASLTLWILLTIEHVTGPLSFCVPELKKSDVTKIPPMLPVGTIALSPCIGEILVMI